MALSDPVCSVTFLQAVEGSRQMPPSKGGGKCVTAGSSHCLLLDSRCKSACVSHVKDLAGYAGLHCSRIDGWKSSVIQLRQGVSA